MNPTIPSCVILTDDLFDESKCNSEFNSKKFFGELFGEAIKRSQRSSRGFI